MKKVTIILIFIAFVFCLPKVNAQLINWNTMGSTQHIINANVGLDYSVSYGIGYGYKPNTKLPIIMDANFSMPSGKTLFDDFKTKIGGQMLLLDISNFRGALALYGMYRRQETELVRLQNFGSDMKATFGYYKSKWFVAAEAGFDKAVVTHFKHSQAFREKVYADVADGWYEPATGGNFSYGLQTGYSFKKTDLTLALGKRISQDFKTAPFLPLYVNLGLNYRLSYH
ncbi:hypothetical protein Q0590_34145 [Rhodocytophaga aerolata]|uniref:Outer membrane beta-barrel protein n=1 Tax=Rhodocytophaga aerolata TaxID=455078 RepID=A0ABT8RGY1_9BACT|nr:hypothetical protein [Rhodocytophaga aerolata]MDO1451367.1 hypothetical protein [Rhodocytophaga aerolata]